MPTRPITYYTEEEVVAPATRTANGETGVLDGYGQAASLRVYVNVTAVSGTGPNLVVHVDDTPNGTDFVSVGNSGNITAGGTYAFNITTPFTDRIKVRWVLTGTSPSFTFSVRLVAQDVAVA